jgi:hypothetical protein
MLWFSSMSLLSQSHDTRAGADEDKRHTWGGRWTQAAALHPHSHSQRTAQRWPMLTVATPHAVWPPGTSHWAHSVLYSTVASTTAIALAKALREGWRRQASQVARCQASLQTAKGGAVLHHSHQQVYTGPCKPAKDPPPPGSSYSPPLPIPLFIAGVNTHALTNAKQCITRNRRRPSQKSIMDTRLAVRQAIANWFDHPQLNSPSL